MKAQHVSKVFFVTAAGLGIGVDIARAALTTVADPREQIDAFRDLSVSLALDDPQPTTNRR